MHLWAHRCCSKKKKWLNRAQAQNKSEKIDLRQMFLSLGGFTTFVSHSETTRKHDVYSEMTIKKTCTFLPEAFMNTDQRMTSPNLHSCGFQIKCSTDNSTPSWTGVNMLLQKTKTQVCIKLWRINIHVGKLLNSHLFHKDTETFFCFTRYFHLITCSGA